MVSVQMLTHHKSTMSILCMLTFGTRDFATTVISPPNFFPNLTYGAKRPHIGLCPKLLVVYIYICRKQGANRGHDIQYSTPLS